MGQVKCLALLALGVMALDLTLVSKVWAVNASIVVGESSVTSTTCCPTMTSDRYPWARAVVINLASRPDRLEQFSKEAARHSVDFDVWPAVENPFGATGCLESHRSVLQALLASGDESWAIFEDDCLFVDDFQEKFHTFFNGCPISWDALWLGGTHVEEPTPVTETTCIITGVRLSHAYIVSYRVAKILLKLIPRGLPGTVHVDAMWSTALSQRALSYAPTEWLCGQSGGYSDIAHAELQERWA